MANRIGKKNIRYTRRRNSVRRRIAKNSDRPRLTVFRSAKHIYAQVIDDAKGRTVASASTASKTLRGDVANGGNVEAAKVVGAAVAEAAVAAGIKEVVFDRSGYKYHGRVKALADAAREKGLSF